MDHTLMHEIATTRQSELLRESARRHQAARTTRSAVRRGPVWTRTRAWRAAGIPA